MSHRKPTRPRAAAGIAAALALLSLSGFALAGCSGDPGGDTEKSADEPVASSSATVEVSAEETDIPEVSLDDVPGSYVPDIDKHDWTVGKIRFDTTSKGFINDADEAALSEFVQDWFTAVSWNPEDMLAAKVADSTYPRLRPRMTEEGYSDVLEVVNDIRTDAKGGSDIFDLQALNGFSLIPGGKYAYGDKTNVLVDPHITAIRVAGTGYAHSYSVEADVEFYLWASKWARKQNIKDATKGEKFAVKGVKKHATATWFSTTNTIRVYQSSYGQPWKVYGWGTSDTEYEGVNLPGSPVGEWGEIDGETA